MEGYSEEEGDFESLELRSKGKGTQLCQGDRAGIIHKVEKGITLVNIPK